MLNFSTRLSGEWRSLILTNFDVVFHHPNVTMPHNTCAQSFEPTVNVTGSTPALEAKNQEKSNTGEWTPYKHGKTYLQTQHLNVL